MDGLLLLSYFCNDHFPLQGKLRSSISPVRKSYFSFFELSISSPIQASFAAQLLSRTVAFEIFLIEGELQGKDSFRRGLQTFPPGSYFPIGDIGHYSASCWSPKTFCFIPLFWLLYIVIVYFDINCQTNAFLKSETVILNGRQNGGTRRIELIKQLKNCEWDFSGKRTARVEATGQCAPDLKPKNSFPTKVQSNRRTGQGKRSERTGL